MLSKKPPGEKILSPDEQQVKINEVRNIIGSMANTLPDLFSDASIVRYLKARNWSSKKAVKMLKDTLRWRLEYKPENIRWEDVAHEAETGKIYRASYCDKLGRIVLVMRPGFQNTNSIKGQIMYLVYSLENAIKSLVDLQHQEQMVWLIDFQGWNMSSISLNVTRETAHILQNHYPERLGLAILYNPPKIFKSFWKMVRPFLEPKTYKKVRFVHSDDPQSHKLMEEFFDLEMVDSAFGGRNSGGFNYDTYAKMMKEYDLKNSSEDPSPSHYQPSSVGSEQPLTQMASSDRSSEASDDEDVISESDGSSD